MSAYENRQTVGSKLDLNMLRFQERPMVPVNGISEDRLRFSQKRMNVPVDKTDARSVSRQKAADRKKPVKVKTTMTSMDKYHLVTEKLNKFDKHDVAKLLGISTSSSRQMIIRWNAAKLIVETGDVSLTGAVMYAKAGTVTKASREEVDKKRQEVTAIRNQNRAIEKVKNRLFDCFGNDQSLDTDEIIERLGLGRFACLQVIRTWRKHDLIKQTGWNGRIKVWGVA